jgi:hypothetical protein
MIWLVDCWSVHISTDFRGWMRANHPQIHVLYIPANCTRIYQLADVILQRPFKHAFRQQFNKYTMDLISKQLDSGEEVKVDFKMSTLKSKLCSWLFSAWLHVSSKQDMVKKGWEKCGLLRSFYSNFQKEALLENMKTPLFKLETNEAMQMDSNMDSNINGEEEINAMESLDTIMIDSLSRVEKLSSTSSAPSMASLCKMARKK